MDFSSSPKYQRFLTIYSFAMLGTLSGKKALGQATIQDITVFTVLHATGWEMEEAIWKLLVKPFKQRRLFL